jgi:hypothetical protein
MCVSPKWLLICTQSAAAVGVGSSLCAAGTKFIVNNVKANHCGATENGEHTQNFHMTSPSAAPAADEQDYFLVNFPAAHIVYRKKKKNRTKAQPAPIIPLLFFPLVSQFKEFHCPKWCIFKSNIYPEERHCVDAPLEFVVMCRGALRKK